MISGSIAALKDDLFATNMPALIVPGVGALSDSALPEVEPLPLVVDGALCGQLGDGDGLVQRRVVPTGLLHHANLRMEHKLTHLYKKEVLLTVL